MNINGRLLLLVVATGIFVRVWMADRQRPRAHVRIPDRISITGIGPQPGSTARAQSINAVPASVSKELIRPAEEYWTVNDCPISLPAGIGAGSYRVIDDTGRVARLEISAPITPISNAAPTVVNPEFFMLGDSSRRWYFIRLRESVASQPDALALAGITQVGEDSTACASPRPCTNRKFDFTGYVDPRWLDRPVTDEIACPEPPDLPVPR